MVLSLSDPNVKREIEHVIESNGWYHEIQLNSRLLQMPPDQFIRLCEAMDGSFDEDAFTERIQQIASYDILKEEGLLETLRKNGVRASLPAILRACGRDGIKIALSCLALPDFAKDALRVLVDKL